MILPQSRPSPHSSPSCSTQSRNAPARPGVRPPPVPAGKEEVTQAQLRPVTTPQRQSSPQVNALPPVKSEQKPTQAPPPPSGLLSTLVPKNNSQPSAVPKPRPDPPTRPPPPCPVNKLLLVIHTYLPMHLFFLSFFKFYTKHMVNFVNCLFVLSPDVFSNEGKTAKKRPSGSC